MKKILNLFLLLFLCLFIFFGCVNKTNNILNSSVNTGSSNISSLIIQSSSIPEILSSQVSSAVLPQVDNSPIIKNDASGIPDAILYKAILKALDKGQDQDFTENEALSLTFFNYGFTAEKIKDIKGIDKLKNLTFLHLAGNEITDISPIVNLKKLKYLNLDNNKITDISKAQYFTSLETVYFSYNSIANISPLSKLISLKELYLWYNEIYDVSPLLNLKNLNSLNIESNLINMSDQKTIDTINTLKSKIKQFCIGLQGVKNTKNKYISPVHLYIGKQQTFNEEENIVYVKAVLNDIEIETDKYYELKEAKTYKLEMWDNMGKGTHYSFIFTISN